MLPLPILLLVIIPGIILPLLWMRRLLQRDRLIAPNYCWGGMLAHVVMCVGLACNSKEILALYCGLLLCLIALSHIPVLQSETHQRLRQAQQDIAKLLLKLERTPEHSGRHFALANAYYNNRQYDEAITEYEFALQLDPGLARAVKGKIKNARMGQAEQQHRRLPAQPATDEEQ